MSISRAKHQQRISMIFSKIRIRQLSFMFRPETVTKPRLVLICGSTGTGK